MTCKERIHEAVPSNKASTETQNMPLDQQIQEM